MEPSKSTRDNKMKCGHHLRGRRLDGADCEYEEKSLETFAFIADWNNLIQLYSDITLQEAFAIMSG